jgi:RNA 2',3'-cyclic 3'-phosphodiesterase
MMRGKARMFFALWPDEQTRAGFAQWLHVLGSAIEGSVTRQESLHLTLVFLGDVELDRLGALNSIAEKMDAPGFELSFNSPHYWRHNRIVHAVPVATPIALSFLVATLERELRDGGFPFDERTYVPHMTLMRRARWRRPDSEFPRIDWLVSDFTLVCSHQQPRGSRYEVIGRWQLAEQ